MTSSGRHSGAVVVTGASQGIGRATAVLLARHGFHVYGGALNEREAVEMRALGPAVTPVVLDVTIPEQIESAATRVCGELSSTAPEVRLAGLFNNAGIGLAAPLECTPAARARRIFEVNVHGLLAVTQAFLPLLRKHRGRLINSGSVGDRNFVPPYGGLTCASKSAVADLTDALRMELRPWGIHVVLVEPGPTATTAIDKMEAETETLLDEFGPEGRTFYGDDYRSWFAHAAPHERGGDAPQAVARAVLRALTARRPRTRYLVGARGRVLASLPVILPDRWLDQVLLRMMGLETRFGVRTDSAERSQPGGA